MKKIVVIGSLNLDFVTTVSHMPASGETILSGGLALIPGGKGANQAYALGRMGADVTMLGAVGKDSYGDMELDNLKQAGVDISHIARVDNPTGMAFILVDAKGDNSIVVAQGANLAVTKEYIDSKINVIGSADIVIFQLEIPLETVIYAATAAKQKGKVVILDPAPAPGKLPEKLLALVDILKPNEVELATLSGIQNAKEHLEEACSGLIKMGVGCVLASIGPDGVYVAQKDCVSRAIPCEPVKVVDSTAAGDSFTAAIAYALANDKDVFSAAEFANRIATVVVTRKGAQSSIPAREEVVSLWQA